MGMPCFCKYIFCLIFCLIPCVAQAKITVALIVPMVGDYKPQGDELIIGIERAISEINQAGGLLKKKIDLLKIDDQCNDSIAVSTAQMLTILKDKKVSLVIGPYCANSFEKVADIYANARIFQIIPTTVNYTHAKTIKKGLVKMLGYTSQEAADFFAFYNKNFAGDKVAVVANQDNAESVAESTAIAAEFQKHGKAVVLKQYNYQMTDKDYAALAERLLADNSKIAFLLGSSANIRKMAYALRRKNENFVIFTNKYKAGEKYFSTLGDYANGTYFMALKGNVDNPEFAETLVNLRLSGFEAEGLALYGYEAVKLWQNIVQKAKSLDYDKLSNTIRNKTINTTFGTKMFHNGAPKANENYAVYKYIDGNLVKVY